ncbi:unnamed protein product, partial [Brassica oleracea]
MMLTNDNSTYSQFQLVPAYGYSSDNKSDADSSGTTTYLDLIANSDLFLDKLHDLPQDSGRIVKDPNVGEEILDLHQLFIEVINRGGIEKCNEVTGIFNLKTEVKNAAYVLRKTDLKMLFELEHICILKLSGLPKLQPGTFLKGFTDGKFGNKYFVTMKTGSHELEDWFTEILRGSTQRCRKLYLRLMQRLQPQMVTRLGLSLKLKRV